MDFGTNLIVNKDMPDDVAYAITKAMVENRDAIVADNKAMAGFVREGRVAARERRDPAASGRDHAITASAAGCSSEHR